MLTSVWMSHRHYHWFFRIGRFIICSHIKLLLLLVSQHFLLLSIHCMILLNLLMLDLCLGKFASVLILHLILDDLLVHGFMIGDTLAVVGCLKLAHVLQVSPWGLRLLLRGEAGVHTESAACLRCHLGRISAATVHLLQLAVLVVVSSCLWANHAWCW